METLQKLEVVRRMRKQVEEGHWTGNFYFRNFRTGWKGCLVGQAEVATGNRNAVTGLRLGPREGLISVVKDLTQDPVLADWADRQGSGNPLVGLQSWNDGPATKADVLALLDRQEARYQEQLSGETEPAEAREPVMV